MYYFSYNKSEYWFRFVKIQNHSFIDFKSKHCFAENCFHSVNGNLYIQDGEIIWSKDDPANFTPEAKNYMNRILKLIAFS